MIRFAAKNSIRYEKRARIVTYVIATLLGGFMIVLGVQYLERIDALTGRGVSAPAQIYRVQFGKGSTGLYRFRVNGQPYLGRTTDRTWNKIITILYLPENPTISEDAATLNPGKGWFEVGIGMVVMCFYFWAGSRIGRRSLSRETV